MNFGRKIKFLRLKKEVTQEALATYLNVSAQSVSKWENNLSFPDICLLPQISVYFGVSIDELFDLTEQAKIERIENMLETKESITKEEFEDSNRYLRDRLEENTTEGKALGLLADLYNHKADEYRRVAEYYAKEALDVEPENKGHHQSLLSAQQGTISDWDFANHNARIDYYKGFVKKNPEYARGYLWLLDELIADNRLTEANEVLSEMKKRDSSGRVLCYEGKILWGQGEHQKAMELWKRIPDEFKEDWLSYAMAADACAYACEYEEAISYYRKAMEIQPSPKYTDALITEAQIREMQGRYPEAVSAWEKVIETMKNEWGYTEGFEREEREIARLNKMI